MYLTINLDKARNFKYGMRAFDIVENLTGQPLSKIDFNNVTMRTLATIMFAGLVHEDKDLTVDKVMDLVDEYSNIEEVAKIIGKAVSLAIRGKMIEDATEEVVKKLENGEIQVKNV